MCLFEFHIFAGCLELVINVKFIFYKGLSQPYFERPALVDCPMFRYLLHFVSQYSFNIYFSNDIPNICINCINIHDLLDFHNYLTNSPYTDKLIIKIRNSLSHKLYHPLISNQLISTCMSYLNPKLSGYIFAK